MKKNIVKKLYFVRNSIKAVVLPLVVFVAGMFFTNSAEGRIYTIDKNTSISHDCVLVETWIYDDGGDNDPSNDALLAYHRRLIGNCSIHVNDPDYVVLEASPVPASDRISVSFGNETYIKCEFVPLQGNMQSVSVPGEFSGTMDIDIRNLSKGAYMLKAYTASGKLGFVKFIKN